LRIVSSFAFFSLVYFFTADPSVASLIYINGTALPPVFEGAVALECGQRWPAQQKAVATCPNIQNAMDLGSLQQAHRVPWRMTRS
jgi:hypothetical protein